MANPKCEIKTELLAEYMATLEKFKVAEREHKGILWREQDKEWCCDQQTESRQSRDYARQQGRTTVTTAAPSDVS